MKNTTFDNNFIHFSFDVTNFGMLIHNIDLYISHAFFAMETILAGNYEFLNYQNVCIDKVSWISINTLARVLHGISSESTGHQNSNKVCRICITVVLRKIWTST